MHVIHWKKQAIKDTIKIGQHIAQDSQTNADKMVSFIESKVMPLAEHLNMGRTGFKRGTRELVAHENYLVIYRVLTSKVEILRVKHTSQQWPKRSDSDEE
ncbi:MAG: type II toxin-antitoxin system RelE/ParE family toxin [Burkholderiales bacterium]